MDTVLAIIIGAAVGVAGFLPLYGGLRLARRATQSSNLGQLGACLLGLLVSFVLLACASIICIVVARPLTLPFVLSEAIALSVSAICFGIAKMLRR